MALGYEVKVGSLTAKWPDSGGNIELVSLRCSQAFGGGRCRVQLTPPQGGAPAPGDAVTVHLDGGGGKTLVFTGELDEVGADPERWRLSGHDGLPKLAALDVEQSWEERSADAVLQELLEAAGLAVGALATGPSLRVFRALHGQRGERLAASLLARMGAEMFVDGAGKVQAPAVDQAGAAHRCSWGGDVVEVQLRRLAPPLGAVKVYALGLDGPTLLKDPSGALGGASGEGTGARTWVDGAVADGGAAGEVAEAAVKRSAARPVAGHVLLLGAPALKPGDTLEVQDLPDGHALAAVIDGLALRVRAVEHSFSVDQGFRTRVVI